MGKSKKKQSQQSVKSQTKTVNEASQDDANEINLVDKREGDSNENQEQDDDTEKDLEKHNILAKEGDIINDNHDDDNGNDNDYTDGDADAEANMITLKKKKIYKLSLSKTSDFNGILKKRGIVYMSRIPPRMNPAKVKHLLSDFGCAVTRVYLVEEDAAIRKQRRKKKTGSGAKRYVEGWIEFESKHVAKLVATSLNNTAISNQKSNVHFGELWNLKYLHKFKWEHLTEKVAYERRVREQKLRVELFQARRENAAFTELVETGVKLDTIEARRKRKHGDTSNPKTEGALESVSSTRRKVQPPPRQVQPVDSADRATKGVLLKSLI